MKNFFFLPGILLISANIYGQSGNQKAPLLTAKDSKIRNYTVSGERHGVSFFPVVEFKSVQYVAADSLTFDKYHTVDVVYTWLRRWEKKYPDIVDLYEVGKSFEGRPIYQMTLTGKKSGKDTDKPAAFFEGGRHSGEVTGTESVLWLTKYLLENYGKDADVTHLIDTKTIYLKPINNPDGHNLYLNTAQSNRSTVRPEDNDGDGLLDEDSPDDLDGNGIILTMRWKDEKKGTWILDPKDSSGRIMKRVPAGKGIYLTSSEGIDNDHDGRINEDGIGGLDLHRNYPENWRPETETTGRGNTQGGAGEYPLSETETRAVVWIPASRCISGRLLPLPQKKGCSLKILNGIKYLTRSERKIQDMRKPAMFITIMVTGALFLVMDLISDTGILEQSGTEMRYGTVENTKITTEMALLISLTS
jgi:hypothetical protein